MRTVRRRRDPHLLLEDGVRAETAEAAVTKRGREVEAEKRAGEAAGADAGEKRGGGAIGGRGGGNGRVGVASRG